jgi:hypothetical protein
MVVAALYAFCLLMPSAAVASGAADHPAHCFTEEQLGLHVHQPADGPRHAHAHEHGQPQAQAHAQDHVHPAGATHPHPKSHHHGTNNGDDNPAACCGLFGLTAMAVDPQLDLGAPSHRSSILPVSFEELSGRGPDRINRPPIILLPL